MRTLTLALLALLTACGSESPAKATPDGSVPEMDAAPDMDSALPEMDAAVVMDSATPDAGADWCETSECGEGEHCRFKDNACAAATQWADFTVKIDGETWHGTDDNDCVTTRWKSGAQFSPSAQFEPENQTLSRAYFIFRRDIKRWDITVAYDAGDGTQAAGLSSYLNNTQGSTPEHVSGAGSFAWSQDGHDFEATINYRTQKAGDVTWQCDGDDR